MAQPEAVEYDWVHDFFRLFFVVQMTKVDFALTFDSGVVVDLATAEIHQDIPGWKIRIGAREMPEPGTLKQAAMFGIGLMRATIDNPGSIEYDGREPEDTSTTPTKRGRRKRASDRPDAGESLESAG